MNFEIDSQIKLSQVEENQSSPIFTGEERQQIEKEESMKDQRCQSILGYTLPSSHNLIATQDATAQVASFANLISSVGLAQHRQLIYEQQALKLKIRKQQQMLKKEQQQRQSKLLQLLQDRSSKTQILSPQKYKEKAIPPSKDEQLDEQFQFDLFYNQNRINFNRLHFLPKP